MMKFLLLFIFVFPAFAQTGKIEANPLMSLDEGADLLQEKFESEQKRFIFKNAFKAPATNGDFVILWGVGASSANQTITRDEYKGLFRIMDYLSSNGFRVVMNFRATGEDLKLAVETPSTSVVLFSGHGNPKGFYDWNGNKVDYQVLENALPNVYQFILSSCHGRLALDDYYFVPKTMKTWAWRDLTNATELVEFLVSDKWSVFSGKPQQ